MADKKEKKSNNKDRRGVLKEIAFAMFPNTYRLVNDYISKKNGEPSEWNKSVFKSFDPIGSRGQAIPGLAKLIYNYAIGNFDDVRGQDNSDELSIRVADAAWRKYNNMPYDKSLIIDNGDGTFRLPDEISKRIRTRRSEVEKSLDINKRKYKELRDAHYRRRRRLLDNVDYEGYLNEEREWKNDKDALMYSAAIMMDMDNLMGMDSVLNGKTGLFNEFNYRNRNIRKDGENGSAGPLNVLGNFHIGQEDGKFYYYDTFDLASGNDFGFIDQLSGGTPFKIKGRIGNMDVSPKNGKDWKDDKDMDIVHPAFNGPGVKEIIRWADGGTVGDSYHGPDDWTSEDLFNPAYSRQSHTASSQKARDERFKEELADQHVKGFTDYVVPAITNTADFIPLVGEVKSAADAVNAYIEGNPGAAALYAMGALPAAGIMSRGSSIIGKAGSKVLRKYSNGMPVVANAVAEIVNQPKKLYNAVKWAIDDIGENGTRKFSEMVPFSARSTAIADKKSAESVKAGIEWLEDYYKHPDAQGKIRKIRESGDVAYSPERMEALKKRGLLNEDGTPNYEKWMESIPVEVGGPSALMDSKVVGFHTPIESAEGEKDVIFNRMGPFYVNPDGLKYIAAHEDNHAMQEIFGLDNWEKVASGYAGANTDTKIGKMFDDVRNKATKNEWYNSPSELHSKLIEWKMKNGLNAGDEITFRHMSDLASDSIFSKFLDFDNADWGDIKNLLNALPVALPVAGVGAVGAYATSGDGNSGEQMFANGGSVSDWKPSKEILDFVLKTERFEPRIYTDGNGIETIGYGFIDPKLIKKYRGKSMSKKEARRIFFEEKVPEFSKYVADSTENFDKLNDDQKDALFSFIYNIGVGSYKRDYPKLHKALKNEDWASAAFNMDAGYNDKKNGGLRDRRNYERLLFGYYSDDNGNVYPLGEYDTGVKMIQDSAHENKNILELMDPMTSTYREAYDAAKLRGDKKFKYGKKQYPVKYDDGGIVSDDVSEWRKELRWRANKPMDKKEFIRLKRVNKLREDTRKSLENGDITEDEYKKILGFTESPIGSLIVEKTGKGKEVADIINQIIDSGINESAFASGAGSASESHREDRMDNLYDYKLMANTLLTLADISTASPGALRILDKAGVNLNPILKAIANNRKIQIASGVSGMVVDGSQISLNPDDSNIMNYAGIIGAAAEAIGGTDVMRRTQMMRNYGNKIDDVLDIANPVITAAGVASDVLFDDGGSVKEPDFMTDISMARDALRVDSNYNPSYSYIAQNDAVQSPFDIESLIRESSGADPSSNIPEIKKHKVQKGDTLWGISKKTGVHIDDIILYNPQIKDINKLEVGDEVNIEAPINVPEVLDYKAIKERESALNKSGDNVAIIKSIRHDNNFAIIDKKRKVIDVYSPDNELLYTGKVGTGKSRDDYNTLTYKKEDGTIIDGKGNNSTPVGITMVSGKGIYHGVPSFIRSRYNKKTGEWDDNLASSMHWGATDGSNGCVRLIGDTANELDKYIKYGTMVYTLPEKEGSRFMVRDGMLSFIAKNPYGKDEEGDPKRYWDDYNAFNDKTYKPIDISQIDSDIDINVNQASMSPKTVARDLFLKFVDTGDRNENVNAFISGIEDYKKAIMADTGIDSATYNDLAEIALGIAEQESKFGTSAKYALKNSLTQDQLDVLKTMQGGAKGLIKDLKNSDKGAGEIASGIFEYFNKPISYRSNGITQIKTKGDNYRTRVLYDKYGIDEESLKNPYISGAGTMLRLASIYRDEVAGREFKGSDGSIDPMDAVLYKWSGRNKLLRSGKANPKLDEYHNNVKRYASNFRINTVDKFDERLGGNEVVVPDKPVMNIDDATPSLVWEKSTGLSDVSGGRPLAPFYAEGGTAGDDGKISMDNYDIAYDYLVNERGVSPQSAIAIMANLENESGMNTGITNSIGAFGIQQWLGPRKSALLKRYGSNPNLRQQLEFLVDEYEGKGGVSGWNYLTKGKNLGTDRFNYYMYSKSDFDNAPTIEDATIAWNQGFGRPATWELNNERRIASAKRLASRFNIPYGAGSYASGQVTPKKKENVAAFQEEVSPAVVRNPGTVVLKKAKEQEPVKAEERKSSYAKKVEEKSNKIAEQRMRDKAKMDFFNLVWNELNFKRI